MAARRNGDDARLRGCASRANFGSARHQQIRRPRVAERHCRRQLQLAPPAIEAGVKFNTRGINRFAMKRPFAAVIIYMLRRTKAARLATFGAAEQLHLTVLQLRLPNLLDRVVGVTTELGWCPSPALSGGKSDLSAPYTVPEQQKE